MANFRHKKLVFIEFGDILDAGRRLEGFGKAMRSTNTVFIFSDEHNRDIAGCYGDPIVKTPHLDRLAATGTRFLNAYTNSPVCVSARASLATGRYPSQIEAWDSVAPYRGSVKGWGHRLIDSGHDVVSIGKLHYRSTDDSNGFNREIMPMHVYDGIGWLSALLRNPPSPMSATEKMAAQVGAGETSYTVYDRDVTRSACEWIEKKAANKPDKPWFLFVGLVAPHFPLMAPQRFYDLYDPLEIPPPRQYGRSERPMHPVIDNLRRMADYDSHFNDETLRKARAGYYGLCSFLDDNVGQIMSAVEGSGQSADTRIIYTTDHGDNLGNRGLWGKSNMYEDSVAIPLIVQGPDVPSNRLVQTPVSLVDLQPTFIEFAGESETPEDSGLPGVSLSTLWDDPDPERPVFSEYHDWASITGMFMLRRGRWKYVCYPGYDPQLFDLASDPTELTDLGVDPNYAEVRADMDRALRKIADVDALNRAAFADQARRIEFHGGREAILKAFDHGYTPPPMADLSDPHEP